jgi:hypothetical protein
MKHHGNNENEKAVNNLADTIYDRLKIKDRRTNDLYRLFCELQSRDLISRDELLRLEKNVMGASIFLIAGVSACLL